MNVEKDQADLETLLKAVRLLGDLFDPQVELQRVLIFLLIAEAGDGVATNADLAKATGLQQSSISRNVMALGKLDRNRKPGLNLITSKTDTADWRLKKIYFTAKGKDVVRRLQGAL